MLSPKTLIFALLLCLHSAPALSEFQSGYFFSYTAKRTISPSVTTASQVVVEANPRRRGLLIYNNSTNSVYLTYGPTSVSATPTRILATFTQFENLGPTLYMGAISAIRNAGSGSLIITELE